MSDERRVGDKPKNGAEYRPGGQLRPVLQQRGLMTELWFLAAASARAIARSRSAGSPMCVSRLQNIPDNWLWPGRSDFSCTDTGTIATSDRAGSSP